jgi:hypothetical protein
MQIVRHVLEEDEHRLQNAQAQSRCRCGRG